MEKITNNDLAMFKERSRTELRSNCDVSRLAWDNVVPALCNEVIALRKVKTEQENMLKRCCAFLGETIQCGVEGEMIDGRHVNVAASDLADEVDDLLKLPLENAQCPTNGLTFGQAIEAMKKGKKVARKGWNGKGIFLWLKEGTKIKSDWCHDPALKAIADNHGGEIEALGTICMKTADDKILTGWLASQTDMLSTDWTIAG